MKNLLIRLDYFLTSLTTHTDLYKFTDRIDVEMNTLSEKLQLTASLNGKNITIPNVPLWINRNLDAKFDRPEQIALSFGYTRKNHTNFFLNKNLSFLNVILDMCSLMTSTINTFDDKKIALEKFIQPNCSVLLVADCSTTSRFGIFVKPVKSENESDKETMVLEIHIDDRKVKYSPRKDNRDFIQLEDLSQTEIISLMHPLGEDIEFR